jgi:hypothetical protein
MKLFTNIGAKLAIATGKAGLKLQKHSPEILLAVGVIGTVGATVIACRATLKVDEVINNHHDKITKIKQGKEELPAEKYSEDDYNKDLTVAYVQTAVDFIKLYAPAVITGVVGVTCIVSGHKILHGRYVGVVAAYNVLDQGFREYRKRVSDEFGEEKEEMIRHNLRKEQMIDMEENENGKPVKNKYDALVANDPNEYSMYSRIFDESCPQWIKDPIHNLAFVRGVQEMANKLLKAKGYVFLNDVYKMLGFDCTEPGQVVGWSLEEGDGFVDFGIYDARNARFVNGDERSAILDFNVDGVVYDKVFHKRRV